MTALSAQNEFDIVVGATRPFIALPLKAATGTLDLTGATVTFKMTHEDGTVVINDVAGEVVAPAATSERIRYKWAGGDTAVKGLHRADFTITFADATILIAPAEEDPITVRIRATA